MAIFNAGGDQPDHARRAARAALAIVEAGRPLAAAHPDWPIFRVGVNTGPAVVGNVGVAGRLSFAAIGDTSNVAARLMSAGEPGSGRDRRDDVASPRPRAGRRRPRPDAGEGQARPGRGLGPSGRFVSASRRESPPMEPGRLKAALEREAAGWAREHLADDVVAWLTTVAADGTPQSSVISFLWEGDTILFYSQPDTPKLRNIARSPLVSFNLQSDPYGDHMLIIEGTAAEDERRASVRRAPGLRGEVSRAARALGHGRGRDGARLLGPDPDHAAAGAPRLRRLSETSKNTEAYRATRPTTTATEAPMSQVLDHDHADHELEDHDRGLVFDLSTMDRRRVLKLLGFGGLSASLFTIVGCGPAGATGTPLASAGATAAAVASGASCAVIPEETAGPFPGDGSNGPDVLSEDGVVRSDIRSSFGSSTTVAEGVPLAIKLTIQDAGGDCAPLAGAAVYLWHCDRDGGYSLYSQAVADENYLRGVQEADDSGLVTFQSIFPACYPGRWPHIHFEVYPEPGARDGRGEQDRDLPDRAARRMPATSSTPPTATARASRTSARSRSRPTTSSATTAPRGSWERSTGDVAGGLTVTATIPVNPGTA